MVALRGIPYLTEVAADRLATLAAACSERHLDAEGCLFAEGEPASGIFLLLSGRVKVVRRSRAGREQVLHEEGPGSTLGEVPVFDGQGYVGSAIAVDGCSALFVPRQALLNVIDRHPEVARRVIQVLSARVRRFALLAADLSLRDTTQRVAALILREAARTGSDTVSLDATREELASHLGTVREEVSRAFSELRDRGILEVARRRIRILDVEQLRDRAGEE
jgi:CRP/FNR family transcriptional regulator, dissimilatory nitrate respiration regulator